MASILVQELSHHYTELPSNSKLDFHIFAIVLLYCMQHTCGAEISMDGVTMSQVSLRLLSPLLSFFFLCLYHLVCYIVISIIYGVSYIYFEV